MPRAARPAAPRHGNGDLRLDDVALAGDTTRRTTLMVLYLLLVAGANFALGFALGTAWLRRRPETPEAR